MKCRFCDHPAIGRFRMNGGCTCYPDDREQCLCEHHARRAQPLDGMYLLEDFTREGTLDRLWERAESR